MSASNPYNMTGEQNATGNVVAFPCILRSVDLLPPASGTATLKIYDSSTTGTALCIFEASVVSTADSAVCVPMERIASSGLYCVLTGTTVFNVGYQRI